MRRLIVTLFFLMFKIVYANCSHCHNYNNYYDYNADNCMLELEPELYEPECENNNIFQAFANGKVNLYFRLRFEQFDDETPGMRQGMLGSLRSQMRYQTDKFCHSIAVFEVTNVSTFFDGHYNSGVPGIGNPQFAIIPELQGTGVTEAYLSYSAIPCTKFNYGRQKIILDNERHVGMEDFRQYPKNFDAISLTTYGLIPNLSFYYAFLHAMNTNLAAHCSLGHNKLRTHLFHICWNFFCENKISVYTYLNRDRTIPTNSMGTYGVRIHGTQPVNPNTDIKYAIEYAYQDGSFNNPIEYNADYFLFEGGLKHPVIYPRVGYEVIGGNEEIANANFRTPLGSEHPFQGWFDFVIPGRGVRDLYFKLSADICALCFYVAYHSFHYAAGERSSFANGIDLKVTHQIEPNIEISAAYSKFNAKRDFFSGNKIWISLVAKFG